MELSTDRAISTQHFSHGKVTAFCLSIIICYLKDRESTIKERTSDIIVQLGPFETIATGEILPLPESTALKRRITDVRTKFNADIPAAKDKSQK